MRGLSRLGVGLTVVSAVLLLALAAELYYLLVHKRRQRRRAAAVSDAASSPSSSSRELLQLFCFKKPPALASTYAQEPTEAVAEVVVVDDDDETVEAQLMRLGSLVGPPRLLFTIKEETKEDLESEGGRSRCGRSRSLGDLLHCSETPYLTPASSPLPPAMEKSYNPLFESPAASPAAVAASPPPKLQFLKDAEEKLYRRALAEEAKRARGSPAAGEEDCGGYITIVVGKNTRVIPLPSPPGSA
ncbi:hypothetical protein CFC21_057359 [Triticum aestivum]|uniref:Uncharacterized protein n=2 Tax=Triticum aestivum TaxID=4565 RepID=A0A9R1GJK7_WHEAT|nr:uncharacterized protein LOC123091769 [Triticum aestivum]KAF7048633.1 hypothetical protein CFC21_057359 [Triticum aestivum]